MKKNGRWKITCVRDEITGFQSETNETNKKRTIVGKIAYQCSNNVDRSSNPNRFSTICFWYLVHPMTNVRAICNPWTATMGNCIKTYFQMLGTPVLVEATGIQQIANLAAAKPLMPLQLGETGGLWMSKVLVGYVGMS